MIGSFVAYNSHARSGKARSFSFSPDGANESAAASDHAVAFIGEETHAFVTDSLVQAVAEEFGAISVIDFAFCQRGENDEIIIFVVPAEHSLVDYGLLLEAEDRLRERLAGREIELRVRAHQGRRPLRAVPVGSNPIYAR